MTRLHIANPYLGIRRSTRVVQVGDVSVGGDNPIRLQSMTNTDTRDVAGTVEQIAALAKAGCEIARVTAPSITDAECLESIQAELASRGVKIPLVADIHFTPNAAMIAALHVQKVRINPGNYADKKKFEVREYSELEYAEELERVGDRFRPLVLRCKERGVSMRIGTNHGSLSDRIMNRFGDTPQGMVESALEFLDVCEAENYHDVIFSMKSSNTQVAVQAYRLLAMRLRDRDGDAPSYPFHVGVTEAGDAEDGRIKSAIGIGSLLADGIGDTIRVSLTEDPVREVPVAAAIARRAEAQWSEDAGATGPLEADFASAAYIADPCDHVRRESECVCFGDPAAASMSVGDSELVRVELDLGAVAEDASESVARLSRSLGGLRDVKCEGLSLTAVDDEGLERAFAFIDAIESCELRLPVAIRGRAAIVARGLALERKAAEVARWVVLVESECADAALREVADLASEASAGLEWCLVGSPAQGVESLDRVLALLASSTTAPRADAFSVLSPRPIQAMRAVAARLRERGGPQPPLVLREADASANPLAIAQLDMIATAVDLGGPLCDGIGDVVVVNAYDDPAAAVDCAYRVLQGARLRTTRTEFISCPSCGRTLFDLEEITARIKGRTAHLKGVKIAIMGCIVNGPGEMADADFGYVGSGVGQVTLYVGKEVIARAVPEAEATDRLVDLIRSHGAWTDPA